MRRSQRPDFAIDDDVWAYNLHVATYDLGREAGMEAIVSLATSYYLEAAECYQGKDVVVVGKEPGDAPTLKEALKQVKFGGHIIVRPAVGFGRQLDLPRKKPSCTCGDDDGPIVCAEHGMA